MTFSPNPEQQLAIDAREGAYALISGPGTGKTATLTARRKALVDSGVNPDDILALTFTREAALEMEKRSGKGMFKTFHSFGYSVLTAELGRIPFEPELRHRLLFALVKRYQVDYKALAEYIDKRRATTEVFGAYNYKCAYDEYESERKKAGWLDFSCMIFDALALLEKPEVRARHQWKYVFADECQDSEDAQYRMLQLITEKYGNVMCIGDPGQAIYGFRGAKPDYLLNLGDWFPGAQTLYLGLGYRSTQTISDYVRKHYPLDIPLRDKIRAARPEVGGPIEYRAFNSETEESIFAVDSANQDPINSVVMARTNRGLALAETYCRMKQIPYRLLGKSGFFKLPAVVRAVAKLRQYADLPTAAAWAITMPGLESYYQTEDATPEDDRAVKSLKTLEQISRKFTLCREFVDFAHGAAHSKKSKKPSLALSTCHQTKGLEFSNVFLMQVRLDNMPHIKGDPAPDGEEARIFLVSISRPKNRLHISWSGTPSVYLHKDLTPAEIVALQEQASRPQLAGPQQNNLFEAP